MPGLRRLSTRALIVICDARKAMFLRNDGTAIRPSLALLNTIAADREAPERDLAGTPPGRRPDGPSGSGQRGPRSAMEQPDYARLDEESFAADVAGECRRQFGSGAFEGLIIAAPARMLGALRHVLDPRLRDAVLDEVSKTLTGFPVDRIAGHLVEEW